MEIAESGAPPGTLRVYLFGRFRAERDVPVPGIEAVRAQELLCYLLLSRQRVHSRRTLAELLWSEGTSEQAHKHLRQALWQILSALDKGNDALAERLLVIEDDWIGTNPRAAVWVDVRAFENALRLPSVGDDGYEARRAAVELYQADLLEGWYQDWCLFERERLQGMYLSALDGLIGDCEVRQDWGAGLHYGDRVLRHDSARERTHRRLMRLHYLAGDRASALRQYQRCVAALNDELGVQPSRPTVRLLEQIRADHFDATQDDTAPQPVLAHKPPELLARLEHIRASLAQLQRQVEREITNIGLVTDTLI